MSIVIAAEMSSSTNFNVPIECLTQTSQVPVQSSNGAAGYDLFADLGDENQTRTINCLSRSAINTGIKVCIPTGYYGRIAPRSGLAFKQGIDVLAGVIDSDYRGEIKVILYNTDNTTPVTIKHGDRIAQIIFERCYSVTFTKTSVQDDTNRGSGGFGSTGN